MRRAATIRRKGPADLAPESDWDDVVKSYAELMGWWAAHVPDSRRMRAGLLDWLFIRPPRVVFLENKVAGGRLRRPQQEVIDLLERCPGVEVAVAVYPEDWPRVREMLR
jgi:hypothetical protein